VGTAHPTFWIQESWEAGKTEREKVRKGEDGGQRAESEGSKINDERQHMLGSGLKMNVQHRTSNVE
jgi:hypothetical protein